jgi:hypothetical protein
MGRKIVCECEILSDPKEVKRKRLQAAFGVDFGEPGKRNHLRFEAKWHLSLTLSKLFQTDLVEAIRK